MRKMKKKKMSYKKKTMLKAMAYGSLASGIGGFLASPAIYLGIKTKDKIGDIFREKYKTETIAERDERRAYRRGISVKELKKVLKKEERERKKRKSSFNLFTYK